MYCTQCDTETDGKYCPNFGTELVAVAEKSESPAQDWSNETRYDVLIRIPEIKNKVAHYASQAQKHMSADEYLKLCDKAFVPVTGLSLTKIATIAQPIYAALGIKTVVIAKNPLQSLSGKCWLQ